ncbi:MAG: beta-lactamase family protein [Sphingomonadales bacterium]|jgi:D-alanyl-D-alanine-carboxypeptidase/D-alanyl-D-alanine-endopeptidase|nr:beta-lactamase family protein [Sphingomonadales bacterium]MBK9005061.1 beta-lactamase family protein [Sphingomonadales bacterium]MBK9267205.1 beta-lactamase family protein [Sphingomonadales bacterium]MBP6434867.1 beta-lactamase family protein [Sphingorhabdus sp.]
MNRSAFHAALLALASAAVSTPAFAAVPATEQDTDFAVLDGSFAKWMDEAHVPGLVWGIVKDGKLVHVKAMGVQELDARSPVTPDTAFRIASMTKAFTGYSILKLRDEGRLRLDDPVGKYVPQTKGWAEGITVGDLLHHTAGFVTDDPWGDRQQPLPEAEFTRMLENGVPFSTAPGTRYEYSNFGYALLGRIVTNVSKQDYASRVDATVLKPLGMASTRYEVRNVPAGKLAMGYRWENDAWSPEPVMPHGAFGAMGGLVTTGNDYAKWVGFLLSAWPASESEAANRKTVRAMQYGGGMLHGRRRPGREGDSCRLSAIYGAGLVAANDCVLGNVLFHGGGFPGYGSHVLLMPEAGVGIFALTNRTYAGPTAPVWDAATALSRSGYVVNRPVPATPALDTAYAAAKRIWAAGGVEGEGRFLAMNFAMDRSDANWRTYLAGLSAKSGGCDSNATLIATGNLSGRFSWVCAKGTIEGNVLLAPTPTPQIQALGFQLTPKP